jgi:hypothetical protein
MIKKLLLTDDYKITPAGEDIYKIRHVPMEEFYTEQTQNIRIVSHFDEWWAIFPSTDYFEINGRVFKGSRKMNIKKGECKLIFDRYVELGLFLADDIIKATDYHIMLSKEESLKKGQNKLSFITNSERYLRERYFEPYIALSKKKPKQREESGGDTFI